MDILNKKMDTKPARLNRLALTNSTKVELCAWSDDFCKCTETPVMSIPSL